MVLSADDMGIRKGLDPIFCSDCGNRIGWVDEDFSSCGTYCEDCAKKPKEDD